MSKKSAKLRNNPVAKRLQGLGSVLIRRRRRSVFCLPGGKRVAVPKSSIHRRGLKNLMPMLDRWEREQPPRKALGA